MNTVVEAPLKISPIHTWRRACNCLDHRDVSFVFYAALHLDVYKSWVGSDHHVGGIVG